MSIRLLVVDDSAFMRRIIADIVSDIDGVEVVGIARNGLDALDLIPKLQPDIITLDVEMPKLNGIDTLKRIKELYRIPVIMLSSHCGADITIEALQIGALDFIEKPSDLKANLTDLKRELEIKIKSVLLEKKTKSTLNRRIKTLEYEFEKKLKEDLKAVVIGASTGGPKALGYLISQLPDMIKVPIFIVQHMPKDFTTSFAARLDNESSVSVLEAQDGMIIQNGKVYLAPGDFHMTLENNTIRLNSNRKLYGVRPSVDYLFNSAAKLYGERLLGIIMTGMGRDGSDGMCTIKEIGGYNIAQNEETCVVYGMPSSAVAKNAVHEVLSLKDISIKLNQLIRVK